MRAFQESHARRSARLPLFGLSPTDALIDIRGTWWSFAKFARGGPGEQSAPLWVGRGATPSAGQCAILFPRAAKSAYCRPKKTAALISSGLWNSAASWFQIALRQHQRPILPPRAWQSLGMKLDFGIVDVPYGVLIFYPHKRDIERQSGTLIDGSGARGNPSGGLA